MIIIFDEAKKIWLEIKKMRQVKKIKKNNNKQDAPI